MPAPFHGGARVSPPRRCGVAPPALSWSRWVSGKQSDWRSRCECVVGGVKLVMCGTSSGGLDAQADSTFSYDLEKLSWSSHTCVGPAPQAAWEHVSASVGPDIMVWWVRGDKLACNVLSTQTWQWGVCYWGGEEPAMRLGFTATSDQQSGVVVLYGGTDSMGLPCSQAYVVNVADGAVSRVVSRSLPPPRSNHAAAMVPQGSLWGCGAGPHLVVWGGKAPTGQPLGDMWALDLSAHEWHPLDQGGDAPAARWGHTLVALGPRVVLYGGEGDVAEAEPVRVYDATVQMWAPLSQPSGDVPPPRTGHYAAACADGEQVVVFGGLEPGGGQRYFDVYGLKVAASPQAPEQELQLSPGPPERAPPVLEVELGQEVRLLDLERENARLEDANRRLRAWDDDGMREQVARAVEAERAKWEAGTRLDRDELLQEMDRIAAERDELARQRTELLAAAERSEGHKSDATRQLEADVRQLQTELQQCRAERDGLAAQYDGVRERIDEIRAERDELLSSRASWAERVRSEVQEEVDAGARQARARQEAEMQEELRLARERVQDEWESHSQNMAAERARMSDEHRCQEELWSRQREEADELRRRAEAREAEAVDARREAERAAAEAERAAAAAESGRADLAAECAAAASERANMQRQLEEANDAVARAVADADEAEARAAEAADSTAQLEEQVTYWRDRALGGATGAQPIQLPNTSPPRRQQPPPVSVLLTGGSAALPSPHAAAAGVSLPPPLPPPQVATLSAESSGFLRAVAEDAARGSGSAYAAPLTTAMKAVRALRLLRGDVTVDTVLDVLHAAQKVAGPQGDADVPLTDAVDPELFKVVVVDLVNRLHGSGPEAPAIDLGTVEAHVRGPLRQLWGQTGRPMVFPPDPALDCMLSVPIAEVLYRYRRGLLKVFCGIAGLPSAPPGADPKIPATAAVTVRQVTDFCVRSGIVPSTVSRQQLAQVCPLCDDSGVGELSPAGFVECLCRCALLGSDAAPSAALNPVAGAQRCSAVIQQALAASAAPRTASPQSRGPTPNARRRSPLRAARPRAASRTSSPSSVTSQPQMSTAAVRSLLRDPTAVQRELQRVWLHYSSTSQRAGVAPQQWVRLLQDSRCAATSRDYADGTPRRDPTLGSMLSVRDAEAVFAELAGDVGVLGYDAFTAALRTVACRLHPSLAVSPPDALQRMLLDRVLPSAHRAADVLVAPLHTHALEPLLSKYRRGIGVLHAGYSQDGDLSLQQFMQLCHDMSVTPPLLSKQEAAAVFRSALVECCSRATLGAEGLAGALVRAAHVAFSKPPYSQRFVTAEHRFAELCSRMSLGNVPQLRRGMEKAGVRLQPVHRPTSVPAPTRPPLSPRRVDEVLNDEAQLDAALRAVFECYAASGEIGPAGFDRLCEDCQVTNAVDFPLGSVRATYAAAHEQQGIPGAAGLGFDGWCDSLLSLAVRRYPSQAESAALRTLLTQCLLPWAAR